MPRIKRILNYAIKTGLVVYVIISLILFGKKSQVIQETRLFISERGVSTSNKPLSLKRSRLSVENNLISNSLTQTLNISTFQEWSANKASFCEGRISFYHNTILHFQNLTLNPKLAKTLSIPGANISQVLNQDESKELYTFQPGFLKVSCNNQNLRELFSQREHVHGKWEAALEQDRGTNDSYYAKQMQSGLTVGIERNEYANVYWTLVDLYDVFLTCIFLNNPVERCHVLIVDARPKGHLDDLWKMYASAKRLNDITSTVCYSHFSWRYNRAKSPILIKSTQPLPLIDEFRSTILSTFHLTPHQRNCNKLNIFFLWRRDYVAHPRNPKGKVSRKITNEDQLLNETTKAFPNYQVTGLQLDSLKITGQLQTISQTDIFIGMHGAGLSYSMFLSKGSTLVELYPTYYGQSNWHMENIARRSGHHYLTWRNRDKSLDDLETQSTIVPIDVVLSLIGEAVHKMCKS